MNIVEAEKAVVGALVVEECHLGSVVDVCPPEFFQDKDVATILTCMVNMRERHEAIDIVTLSNEIRTTTRNPLLAMMIPECIDACVSAGNARNYARIVAGMHYERQVSFLAKKFTDSQQREHLTELSHALMAKERLGLPLLFDYEKDLHGVLDDILDQSKLPVSDTGFAILDSVLLGVRAGEVITWGAAPNVGKSLMLLNLANTSSSRHQRGLYVGTEMSARETVQRHLSIVNGIEPWKLRKGKVSSAEVSSLLDSLGERMSKMPLSILDFPEPTIKDIDAAIVGSKAEVVFLDYLERFNLPRAENMRLRVSEFMRQIKNMARERKVIIHLASQLSRSTYGKDERRPTMADLSESSGIEKESDRVILLWAPREKQDPTPTGRKRIEAILEKNRHGKKGLVFDLILSERNLRIAPEAEHSEPTFFEESGS